MYWNKNIELIDKPTLNNLQTEKLKKQINIANNCTYYKNLFKKNNITPESIKSPEDIKKIPFTTKEDLRSGFPEDFLAVDHEQVVRLHSSSGTTGTATVIYHTQKDLDVWSDLIARCLYMIGVRKTDVFQNMMGYGLFTGGLGVHYGDEKLGSLVIPSSSGNSKRQIKLMLDYKTTAIHIIPSYAMYLHKHFQNEGLDPKKDTCLKIALIGAEPHTEELRRKVEYLYGVKAFNSYGLSEMNGPGVAFECEKQNGLHLWEDNYLMEIIDPETGEHVKPGDEGELVLTILNRQATPLFRYRTRDITREILGSCECGRTHRRIARIKGRDDDMFILRGVNIFPMQIEDILMSVPEVGNNYIIELMTENLLDKIKIKVEINPDKFTDKYANLTSIIKKLTHLLKDEILVTPEIELVEPHSLPASEGKAVRLIDNRNIEKQMTKKRKVTSSVNI